MNSFSLAGIVEIAVPLALVVSLALRWMYLRAVRRSMLRTASAPASPGDQASREPPTSPAPEGRGSAPLDVVSAPPPAREDIRAARRAPWLAAGVHVAAGSIYAVAVALVWAWLAASGFFWEGILLFALFFIWPAVIVVSLVAAESWYAVVATVLIYAVLFVGAAFWLTQGTGITLSQLADNWWNMNGMGTLLVLASLARPIRAMGPIVVALMMAGTAGVFAMADLMGDQDFVERIALIATQLGFSGSAGGLTAGLIVLGLAALASALVAYVGLRGVGLLYQARWISDQSIQVDAVWLIFAILHAPTQLPLAGLAAFLAYELVARLGLRLVRPWTETVRPPPRLLLLRVFALGPRSERLFRGFSRLWRYSGSVRMIAGPDLANATVEPHEFLDFLAGRLQRRFISGSAVLEQRLAETQLQRDPDGRFRVSSFFCHADTWQAVLQRLARDSDLVLMDLRGFTRTNEGCVYEINELLDTVPLEHVLFVVDGTTDDKFLTEALQQGWANIGARSPNRADAAPRVRLYRLDDAEVRASSALVATLVGSYRRALRAMQPSD